MIVCGYVDKKTDSLLMTASEHDHADVVHLLLEHDVQVDLQDKVMPCKLKKFVRSMVFCHRYIRCTCLVL